MTRRATLWLLAPSLLLNLAFLGGYFQAHAQRERTDSPAGWREALYARLALTPEQQLHYQEVAIRVRDAAANLEEESEPLRAAFWSALAADPPDRELLKGLLRQLADNRLSYQEEVLSEALTFLEGLDGEQRAAVRALLMEHDKLGLARRPQRRVKESGPDAS